MKRFSRCAAIVAVSIPATIAFAQDQIPDRDTLSSGDGDQAFAAAMEIVASLSQKEPPLHIDMPDEVPMTTQERAYTSPIWYTP